MQPTVKVKDVDTKIEVINLRSKRGNFVQLFRDECVQKELIGRTIDKDDVMFPMFTMLTSWISPVRPVSLPERTIDN